MHSELKAFINSSPLPQKFWREGEGEGEGDGEGREKPGRGERKKIHFVSFLLSRSSSFIHSVSCSLCTNIMVPGCVLVIKKANVAVLLCPECSLSQKEGQINNAV